MTAGAHTLRVRRDDVDEIAVERRVGGDRNVRLTTAERHEVIRILNARGVNDIEIGRITGIHPRVVIRDRAALGIPAVPKPLW